MLQSLFSTDAASSDHIHPTCHGQGCMCLFFSNVDHNVPVQGLKVIVGVGLICWMSVGLCLIPCAPNIVDKVMLFHTSLNSVTDWVQPEVHRKCLLLQQ